MKTLHISKSNNDNYYFIDNDHKVIRLAHPELAKLYLEDNYCDESSYYLK